MKKTANKGGWGTPNNPRLSPSTSFCSALLVQGRREGWRMKSYRRVAESLDSSNPIESIRWSEFARRLG